METTSKVFRPAWRPGQSWSDLDIDLIEGDQTWVDTWSKFTGRAWRPDQCDGKVPIRSDRTSLADRNEITYQSDLTELTELNDLTEQTELTKLTEFYELLSSFEVSDVPDIVL